MWELFVIVTANMLLRVPHGNILGCGVVMVSCVLWRYAISVL